MNKKVLLIILDGFGYGKKYPGNAIELANMKFEKSLRTRYPTTTLKANGEAVGLPKGSMGGSEVGHFTMGAGRVVWQSLEHINREIKNGKFAKNEAILKAIRNAKKHNSALHLIGMISDEGVHSHINHLFACLELAKKHRLNKIFIHAVTDGRDVPERSAQKYIKKILKRKIGTLASIAGRYYAMDRDTNWSRTKKAFNLYKKGEGFEETNPIQAIKNAYARGDKTDYYIQPIILTKKGTIGKNDSVIFWNFRTDRAKQLTELLAKEKITLVIFGEYSGKANIAFHSEEVKNNLGETLTKNKIHQLRIAETEKYAHVTFFFNSQIKDPYPLEKRILIPSPKVPSYAQKPEMSAYFVTSRAIKEIAHGKYGFIALNYANADLVGHSGEIKPTIECCKHLDKCLSQVVPEALKHGYDIILTADHGNADTMLTKDNSRNPAHSFNPVLCTIISKRPELKKIRLKKERGLAVIGPTILKMLGIEKPKEMEEGIY